MPARDASDDFQPDLLRVTGAEPAREPQTSPAAVSPKKTPTFYDVPMIGVGNRMARCSGEHCDALIFWVDGKKFPISCAAEGCVEPTHSTAGRGISHYVDCPDRQAFSGRNRAK